MSAHTIAYKTAAGQIELARRDRQLGQRHRTVLFLVDGRRRVAEVLEMAQAAGVGPVYFDELVHRGLVGLVPSEDAPTLEADAPLDPDDVQHVDLPLESPSPSPSPDAGTVTTMPQVATTPAGAAFWLSSAPDDLAERAAAFVGRPADHAPVSRWPESSEAAGATDDIALDEARELLLRGVRSGAPVAGSLTAMRLRRARTRRELAALLDEAESWITRPPHTLMGSRTMQRVRLLLDGRMPVAVRRSSRV